MWRPRAVRSVHRAMLPTYEVSRVRLEVGARDRVLAERPRVVEAVRERVPGLLDATLVELSDGTFLDVLRWESDDAASAAASVYAALPEWDALQADVAELLDYHRGTVALPA